MTTTTTTHSTHDAELRSTSFLSHIQESLRGRPELSALVVVPSDAALVTSGPIAVGVDASPSSRVAARWARELALELDVPLIPMAAASELEPVYAEDEDARRLEARRRRTVQHRSVSAARRVLGDRQIELVSGPGPPALMFARRAREHDAALLVLPAGGPTTVPVWELTAEAGRAVAIASATPRPLARR